MHRGAPNRLPSMQRNAFVSMRRRMVPIVASRPIPDGQRCNSISSIADVREMQQQDLILAAPYSFHIGGRRVLIVLAYTTGERAVLVGRARAPARPRC